MKPDKRIPSILGIVGILNGVRQFKVYKELCTMEVEIVNNNLFLFGSGQSCCILNTP